MRSIDRGQATSRNDLLATEEPMEIRLRHGRRTQSVAVTMRTPGADFELAAGFLFAENLIHSQDDIGRIEYCLDCEDVLQQYNIVTVALRGPANPNLAIPDRNFGMTSSCGLCGKERLDQIERQGVKTLLPGPVIDHTVVTSLPDKLRDAQGLFTATGGLHAAGLFTAAGELLVLREDVGRHNAVDKAIGWAFLEGMLPLSDHMLMVSGRSSFEIAQKCLAAGLPVLCAVSAPSSLAVDLAQRFGMTLVGFLRGERFNVYAGSDRIRTDR
ncbi:formate dehydrogenase accessory sulfurtransferase FdhD [soil metagenome]